MSWDSNLAAVEAAVAGYFDTQAFAAYAMRKPTLAVNKTIEPDPARPSFEFMGTLELDPGLNALGSTENATSGSIGDRQVARVCLTALSSAWPWMPRQGDIILHRPIVAGVPTDVGATRYAISAALDRDGSDRIVAWLNKAKD